MSIGSKNKIVGKDMRIYGSDAPDEEGRPADVITEFEQKNRQVFIIHGHNEAKWRELAAVLHKLEVEPIELSEQVLNGGTIIENFERYANMCSFAFAVFTYDDVVHKDSEEEYLQVRPNVIFELGWFYAKLGRRRVMIIDEESDKGNVFSDLAGIYRYTFHRNISELYGEIETVLKAVGVLV